MSLVIDTLRTSPVTEELSQAEVEILATLFEVQEFKAGEIIVQPNDVQPDNLYILFKLKCYLILICNSLNCSSLTFEGESSISDTALAVLGKAITSLIELSPVKIIAILSNPKATRPAPQNFPFSKA